MKSEKKKWVIRVAIFVMALLCIYFVDRRRINTKKIYVIGQDRFKDMVPDNPEQFTDRKVPKKRTITLNGEKLELTYQYSLLYPVGQEKLHKYVVDGDKEKMICLGDDGKVKSMTYAYAYLSVSIADDAYDVLEKLKPQLEKDFDISKYKYTEMPKDTAPQANKYSWYEYEFYNETNGCRTQYFRVRVKGDGGVTVSVQDLDAIEFPLFFINKRKMERALKKKMQDLYTNDDYEYISCEYRDDRQTYALMFRNELSLYLHVNVKYFDLETESEVERGETIVIPVHMISY